MIALLRLLVLTIAFAIPSLSAFAQNSANVYTDKEDYWPGEVVIIEGDGWKIGETVRLEIDHSTVTHGNTILYATADTNGHIYNNQFIIQTLHLHERFTLSATGQSSGFTATTTFTDGIKTFTGPGSFSDNTKWNGNTVPQQGDDIVIIGTCTFDAAAANVEYGTLTLGKTGGGGDVGIIKWASGSTNTLSITDFSSVVVGGRIDVRNGSLFKVRGNWNNTNMILEYDPNVPWTVEFGGTGSQTIPLYSIYSNLIISGSRSSNIVTIPNGIGITRSFSPNASFTTGSYTVSSIEFKGTGDQTIPTFAYQNLIISGVRSAGSNITLASGTISVSGSINATASFNNGGYIVTGNTILLNGSSSTQSISGSPTFNNLISIASGPKSFSSGSTIKILGNFNWNAGSITSSSTTKMIFAGSGKEITSNAILNFAEVEFALGSSITHKSGELRISKNFTNNGSFTQDVGQLIVFNGGASTPQSISGNTTTFKKVKIATTGSGGVSLSTGVNIDEDLSLTSGLVTTGSNVVTLNASATISNSSLLSYINGKLSRVYNTIGSKMFPIGKGGNYRPLSINYTTLSGASSIIAEQIESALPGTLPTGAVLLENRQWALTESGGSAFSYNISLDPDAVTPTGPVYIEKNTDGTVTEFISNTPNYTATGLTSFGHFALAHKPCTAPSITTQPTAPASTCSGSGTQTLTVAATGDGLTYSWRKNGTAMTNSSVVSGQGTNTLTLTNPTEANAGSYDVIVSGSCEPSVTSDAVTVTITAKPIWYIDADGDHYSASSTFACTRPTNGYLLSELTAAGGGTGDCSDSNPAINPGATETCNGIDDDCDGQTDEGFTDTDGDGTKDCQDSDDDNDGILDAVDSCPTGETGWTSNGITDRDSDGCRDAGEDTDDDNDGKPDAVDACPVGEIGWTSNAATDRDNDGCRDATEDLDDDNDGVADNVDLCPAGEMGWTSNNATDHDHDGCRDVSEDLDDDNDGKSDNADACPRGETGWTSTPVTDHDADGCRDASEDSDDDNDGVLDAADACPQGNIGWTSNGASDNDHDGCRDTTEDTDDDNDGILDGNDCEPLNPLVGAATTWYIDADGDKFYGSTTIVCNRPVHGFTLAELTNAGGGGNDCDDSKSAVHPGATEVCNGIDDDCDGTVDDGFINTQVVCPQSGTVTKNLSSGCTYTVAGTEFNATATENCGALGYTLTGATTSSGTSLAGVALNVGNTTVTWSATKSGGQAVTCSFVVTVVPPVPTVTCPDPITVNTDAGQCDAVVNYTAPVAPPSCPEGGNVQPTTVTFNYTGSMQTFTAPVSGIYTLETWGASGGNVTSYFITSGGKGGYAKGTYTLSAGQTINLYVGGKGQDRLGNHPYEICTYAAGGWNGGGGTRSRGNSTPGGGASDVRVGGTDLSNRVIVGAGGGGAGWQFSKGGNGGGLQGSNGTKYNESGTGAYGGTQINGGDAGSAETHCSKSAGTLGQGGDGGGFSAGGGGGGGGYFGGGGGGYHDGGGGGSSYIGGVIDGITTSGVNNGDGKIVISYGAATVQPSIAQTAGLPSGSKFPVGTTTNTFEVTDAFGQKATCSFAVTVNDITPPSITQPSDITVANDATKCEAQVNFAAQVSDNCGRPTVKYFLNYGTQTPTQITFPHTFSVGSHEVTIEAKDASGNASTKSFTVTVEDKEKPSVEKINTISACFKNENAAKAAAIAATQYSDNCTEDDQLIVSASVSGTCSAVVTVSVTDASGNSRSVQFNTRIDNTAPVFTSLPANATLTVACHQVPSVPSVTANDGCSGIVGVVFTPFSTKGSDPTKADFYNYTITRKWETVDDCGNEASFTQTITVQDITAPQLNCPANITQANDERQCNALVNFTASASDNCSSVGVRYYLYFGSESQTEITSPHTFAVGEHTVTVVAKDVSGNEEQCSFTVTVNDTEKPNVVTKNITVQLNANGMASLSPAQINNNSTDNCAIPANGYSLNNASFNCSNVGQNTVILTVTDVHGNSHFASATVTVEDKIKPTVHTQPVTIYLDANGQATLTPSQVNNNSADNCSIPLNGYSLDKTSFDCFNVGANTVTLTVTDINGNAESKTAEVTVVDNVKPTVVTQNIIVQLNATGNASITPAMINNNSSDNCSIPANGYSLNTTTFNCSNVGQNTVTLTVTDVNGNSDSKEATVTVEDNIKPTVITQNITVQLNSSGEATITAAQVNDGSTDNCSIPANGYALSKSMFNCSNVGQNTVTLTVTDVNGNSDNKTAVVTVEDKVAPVARCQNISVYLGQNGLVTISEQQVDNGSSDACGVQTLALNRTEFGTVDVGNNTVTLTVTDVNGNVSTCQATVTVMKRPTILVYTGDNSEQYSDEQILTAELRDELTNTVLGSKTISFAIGSQSTSANTSNAGLATSSLMLTQDPLPVYSVITSFAGDAIYKSSSDNDNFDITQENAQFVYSGSSYFTTPSSSNYQGAIILSTSINDTDDGATIRGDVRKAKVTFTNGSGGAVLGTEKSAVGLVNPGVLTEGISSTTHPYTLNNSEASGGGKTFEVWTTAFDHYTGTAGPNLVTLALPGQDYVTGGGHYVMANSAGTYAGTATARMNFGFTMKWNKSGKNLQGQINIVFRRQEMINNQLEWRVYQIKSNAINSMSVRTEGSYSKAVINTKATLNDITNPLDVLSKGGGHDLTLEVWDNSSINGGSDDKIGVKLIANGTSDLLFASSWSSSIMQIQTITGGNINARNNQGAVLPITTQKSVNDAETALKVEALALEVNAYPNPSAAHFTVQVKTSDNQQPVQLRITDIGGRVLQTMLNVAPDQSVRMGQMLRPGTYLVEARQGSQRQVLKVVKL